MCMVCMVCVCESLCGVYVNQCVWCVCASVCGMCSSVHSVFVQLCGVCACVSSLCVLDCCCVPLSASDTVLLFAYHAS